jgi:hypothetical protein
MGGFVSIVGFCGAIGTVIDAITSESADDAIKTGAEIAGIGYLALVPVVFMVTGLRRDARGERIFLCLLGVAAVSVSSIACSSTGTRSSSKCLGSSRRSAR